MKKAVIIILALIIGLFFLIFDVSVGDNPELQFVDDFQVETGHSGFYAENVYSTPGGVSFRLTFENCQIDSSQVNSYNDISMRLARKANEQINQEGEFDNIILVFQLANSEGIQISEILKIYDLTYSFETSELTK